MQNARYSLLLTVSLLLISSALGFAAEDQARPNIVVILADDLGFGDVQCNNPERGKIPTPRIDRLAAEGLRFTDAHSSSGVCSPSRYSLLTGRYHWRTRLQQGIVGVFAKPLIAADRLTIGRLAQQAGYRTAAIGKWHLGWDWPIPQNERTLFAPGGLMRGKKGEEFETTAEHRAAWERVFSQSIPGGPTTRGFDEYFGTDVPNWPPYCFIENDRTQGIPSEFLPAKLLGGNMASLAGPALADWKLEPTLPALADRAADFIARQAKAKKPFLLYLPLTTPHTPLAVNSEWRGKSGLSNAFADLVMETDAAIGRVLDALEKNGVAGNTLVVFTADNGCAPYIGAAELERRGHFPSGPLRGYKGDVFEGGHRVPFIVRWPGIVEPRRVSAQLVQHADLMATFAEILQAKLPPNAAEDSFSLLPLLQGKDVSIRENAVNHSSAGVPSVRHGNWKLILAADAEAKTDSQLYDLATDLGERKNLAAAEPERVKKMTELYAKLIADGRSTPGDKQSNDVQVPLRRAAGGGAAKKAKQ